MPTGRRPDPAPPEPDRGAEVRAQLRLWGLSLICAVIGTVTLVRTDSMVRAVFGFLVALAVLGPILYAYERRRKNR